MEPFERHMPRLTQGVTRLADDRARAVALADQLAMDLDLAIEAMEQVFDAPSVMSGAKRGELLFVLLEVRGRRDRRNRVAA